MPGLNLRKWVRYYWALESDEPYTHHGMASVCPELVFHYKGRFDETDSQGNSTPSFTAGLQAQSRHTKTFVTNTGFGIFGAYLFPQAIPMIFGYPATKLSDRMEDLTTLIGLQGAELEEKIALAGSHEARAAILDRFIESRLSKQKQTEIPVFEAIHHIISQRGLVSVKSTAAEYFLSERQFERQFQQYAGLGPKLFSRIVRFHHAIDQYGAREKSLTDIAYECGYFDQAHFIHDFREFSGQHPRHYFSGNSPATAWRD